MDNAKFEMNTEGRDFFVGDLHGMYDAFMAELDSVQFDFEVDRVFSVGDLADRGPDSIRCLLLLEASWFHAVRGNHEDFLLGSHANHIWHMNGGEWAFNISSTERSDLRDLVRDKMHRTMTVETLLGTIGVVHAESADNWNHNSELTNEINSWSRTRIRCKQDRPIENIDRVVVGHTVLKEPVLLGNILYIDTGPVFNGKLTMLDSLEVFQKDFKVLVGEPPKPLSAEEERLLSVFI